MQTTSQPHPALTTPQTDSNPVWQILDIGSIWMREFTSALSRIEPIVAWQPVMLATGAFQSWERTQHQSSPPLNFIEFPLQRGYARGPIRSLLPYQNKLLVRLLAHTPDPENSPLLCSTPYYAPLAEGWPGPVIYYSTDLTSAYPGLDANQINDLEKRLCRVARLVCPNSRRIANHFEAVSGCNPKKILVVPNATRSSNIAAAPAFEPGPLPPEVSHLARPVVGVLGDLSANMDWPLLKAAIQLTPAFTWLFVGPTKRSIPDPAQSEAREWVKQHATFVGLKPYGELQAYARSLDVAVLPYHKHEPTYSGSSTRFYEHLAALRPMIATRGFAELLEKEPLLKLIDTPQELAEALGHLKDLNFHDSHEHLRWEASQTGTWEYRAATMADALRTHSLIAPA